MGFGGAAGAMNTVIKNNRNLLSNPKRDKFERSLGGFSNTSQTRIGGPTASPQTLRAIKEKLVRSHKEKMRIRFFIMSVIAVTLITILLNWMAN